MSSTIGGKDPHHDLSNEEKDKFEGALLAAARRCFEAKKAKERKKKLAQANEVSRQKSSKADHH